MDKDELAGYREQLLRMRANLQERARELADAGARVVLDQTRVGRLSRMDAMQAQEMALSAERQCQAQLAAIEGALGRIERGLFGVCFICGEPIAPARLALNPTHTRCVECVGDNDA